MDLKKWQGNIMDRNRLLYFLIAALLMTSGYIIRMMNMDFAMEGSFVFITMGLYFLLAVIIRKAASWVLVLADFAIVGGLQGLSKMNFKWYNIFYASDAGKMVLGGPFAGKYFIYILMGIALGVVLELVIRQYNSIGLGN